LAAANKAAIRELLDASERTSLALKRGLPEADFPHTRRYVLRLIEDGLASLRHLLTTGQTLPLSTDRLERGSEVGCSSASSRSAAGGPHPERSICWPLAPCMPCTRHATRRLRQSFEARSFFTSRS